MHRGCRSTGTNAAESLPSLFAGGAGAFFAGGAAATGSDSQNPLLRTTTPMRVVIERATELGEGFHTASVKRMGRRRIRFPVTANRALAMAGAAQGTPGSPIPPDFSSLSTM